MSEAKYRGECLAVYRRRRPQAVIFRHEDSLRAGIPDTSIGLSRIVSWWEFKHAAPAVKWRGAQAAELQRLHSTGIPAYYVVFQEKQGDLWTLIVAADARYRELRPVAFTDGFNYRFVADFIDQVHCVA